MSDHTFDITWTGAWPALCCGHWVVKKDGEEIPCPFEDCDANTWGNYPMWYFDEVYLETWEEERFEGLQKEAWIEEYKDWLSKVSDDPEDWSIIYDQFQAQDFRRGTCGGCI